MKKFKVNAPSNLKDFTDSTYPQGSFVYSILLRASDIRVNGVKVNKNVMLKVGDEVTYYTTPKQESKASHLVAYEDDNVLVADKMSGVSIEALTVELAGKGDYRPAHRLDRNTCGLLVFAKNDNAERVLLEAFKDRKVEKTYICIAKNNFKKGGDVLCAYLSKDESKGKVTVSGTPKQGFVKIVTEYSVLESVKGLALVEVKLHTGKTHQIRAHLSFIGCPLLGDEKYGDEALNDRFKVKRQQLISKRLHFELDGDLSYLNDKTFVSSFTFDEILDKIKQC
jgi:23S rRNA pseudouridine955/2504/2580 synthase